MKKKTLLAAMALLITVAACIKEKKSVTPQQTDDDNGLDSPVVVTPIDSPKVVDSPKVASDSISITGIDHIPIDAFGMKRMDLNVKCDSCGGDEIFLSVEDLNNNPLPASIQMKFSKESGYSDFNTQLETRTYFVGQGPHHIKIIATNRKGKKTIYNKSIIVDRPTSDQCASFFYKAVGARFMRMRHMTDGATSIDTPINLTTEINSKHPNNFYLRRVLLGFIQGGYWYFSDASTQYHLLINFNCNNHTLEIPEQVVIGKGGAGNIYFTVKGTGKYNIATKTFEIEYTSTYKFGGTNYYNTFKLETDLIEW